MRNPGDEDADMKIAGEEKQQQPEDTVWQDAKELQRQHENGNLGRARALGRKLAQMLRDVDGEAFFGRDPAEDGALRSQRRLLFAFTACYSIEKFLSRQLLQDVTLNAFYNTLKSEMPELYGSLDSAGSFSFYYLCVRRDDGRPAKAIGRYFAMLSGKRGQEVIERLGEALFLRFCDVMRAAVRAAGFEKD